MASTEPAIAQETRPRKRFFTSALQAVLDEILGLRALKDVYAEVAGSDSEEFGSRVLEHLGIGIRIDPRALARIPVSGPVVLAANHPAGPADGLVLAAVVARVRKDFRFLANRLLEQVPEIAERSFLVDVFGGKGAGSLNSAAVRKAIRWVRAGHALGVFPAGEVAHWRWSTMRVQESAWSQRATAMIRLTGAPVVPVHIEGTNGPLFHASGLIHPRLRTALLGRSLLAGRDAIVHVSVGTPILPGQLPDSGEEAGLARALRARALVLGGMRPASRARGAPPPPRAAPVAPPLDPAQWRKELALLPADRCLAEAGALAVHLVLPGEAPGILDELGRLRELTFREVGEGTGQPRDIDAFDATYSQLVLHDRISGEVVGGYRFAKVDEVLAEQGTRGLYTSTLFDVSPAFYLRLGPSIELGRSFIVKSRQKGFTPLMLLWKAIGAWVSRHPRYRWLFGPVSLSRRYSDLSLSMILRWLARHAGSPELAETVRPRTPPQLRTPVDADTLDGAAWSLESLDALVSDVEPDGAGIPTLVKEYLRLGGRFLAFNRDPGFGDAIDGLVAVDLLSSPSRLIEHYMGRTSAGAFRAFHGR